MMARSSSSAALMLTVCSAALCAAMPVAAGESVSGKAPNIKWTVKKTGGSGFVDALTFDGKSIVADSKGQPRVSARLAVPPAGALPVGVRVNWRQLPARLEITGVTGSGGGGTEVTGKLIYPDGAAEGSFKVKLRASKESGVLLSDLELSWSKLPAGTQLVEAGLELETVFEPKEIISFMRPDPPRQGSWDYRLGGGYGVAPVMVGSYVPGPTGGHGVRFLAWLQESPTSGARLIWGSRKGKCYRMVSTDSVEWFDLSEERRGVAVIMKGAKAAAPKMFGTLSRNPRSLYAWAWPPTVDGLAVKTGEKYTCTGIAWYFHKGRACWLKRATHNLKYFHGTERGRVGADKTINELRKKLPALAGTLVRPKTEGLAKLPSPDLAWMPAHSRQKPLKITLPPADPKPEGNRVPILVAGGDPTGANAAALPFRCGVPFPKGKLKDATAIRLLSKAGKELPCQVERTAVWPDGSVKWALVDFLAASPGGKRRVAAHLEWGKGVSRKAAPPKPVKVSRVGDVVTVDTGIIRFTAGKSSCGFLRTVDLDINGDGKYSADERVIKSPGKGERRNHFVYVHQQELAAYLSESMDIAGKLDPADVEVESVKVEAAGPIRATLRIRGKYRHKHFAPLSRERLGRWGQSLIPRGSKAKSWTPPAAGEGSAFTVWLTAWAGSGAIRIKHDFVFEGVSGFQQTTAIGLSARLAMDSAGRKVSLETADPTKPLRVKLKAGEGLSDVQYQRGRARALKTSGPASGVLAAGSCASDWVDVSGERWGLTLGLKDMWTMGPQAIEVTADGAALYFWPPHSAPWDSRGTGGCSGAFTGISRTHDAVLYFHPAGAKTEDLRAAVRHFTRPAYAHASSWWTCSSGALGLCHPYDPERFPKAESLMRRQFLGARRRMMLSRSMGQPGLACYGSCDSTEAYTQYALALQAARTGGPGQYRAALAKCRFDAGMAFRKGITRGQTGRTGFTANHPTDWGTSFYRSCGDAGFRGGQLMYYLTGDEPLRDFADFCARGFISGKVKLDLKRHRVFDHYGRAAVGHLLWAWERGGKGDYAAQVAAAFSAAKPGQRKLDNGSSNALVELYVHSREPAVLKAARGFADAALTQKKDRRWAARVTMPALVYWSSGEEKYLGIMKAQMRKPPMGGAFWHWTMYEMMHMTVNMAAMAKHAVPEPQSGSK
jgi:PcRGLX-like N-terminal RIFT barrel domain